MLNIFLGSTKCNAIVIFMLSQTKKFGNVCLSIDTLWFLVYHRTTCWTLSSQVFTTTSDIAPLETFVSLVKFPSIMPTTTARLHSEGILVFLCTLFTGILQGSIFGPLLFCSLYFLLIQQSHICFSHCKTDSLWLNFPFFSFWQVEELLHDGVTPPNACCLTAGGSICLLFMSGKYNLQDLSTTICGAPTKLKIKHYPVFFF